MAYKKISIELIVFAEDADAVIANLNTALDRIEEQHALFGGSVEALPVKAPGKRRKTALSHTLAAAGTAADALKTAHKSVTTALRHVI